MTTSTTVMRSAAGRSSAAVLLGRLGRHRGALIGLGVLLVLGVASFAAPLLTSLDPLHVNPSNTFQPPSSGHWMGTDNLGRDVLARFLYGGRISLVVGLVAVSVGSLVGTSLGLVAGYYGRWLDTFLSWWVEVLLAFPGILLALAIVAILGPGLTNVMIAVGLAFIPSFMRMARGTVLSVREQAYVEAAQALGSPNRRIITRHILPNVMRPLLVLATLGMGGAILEGAALSFLGLGAQPPTPEWGAMLNAGRSFVRQGWWITVFPGLGIFLAVLAINLLGDGLGDALSPEQPVKTTENSSS